MKILRSELTPWLAALRSGNFKQGKGGLKQKEQAADSDRSFSHCCIGVYCEVKAPERFTGLRPGRTFFQFGSDTGLPSAIWAAKALTGQAMAPSRDEYLWTLDLPKGLVCADDRLPSVYLPGLNDHHNVTFDQIADLIEYLADVIEDEEKA